MSKYLIALGMMLFGLIVMWIGHIGNIDRLYLTGMIWMAAACTSMITNGNN